MTNVTTSLLYRLCFCLSVHLSVFLYQKVSVKLDILVDTVLARSC